MVPARVPKFSGVVRTIGGILLIPSFLGIAFAALMFFSAMATTAQVRDDTGGAGIAMGFIVIMCLIIGVVSLVGGLLGWLLLMNRNVWKCMRCDAILDRA